MGMNVNVKLLDLVNAVPHLAGLSVDKTDDGETVVTVTRNEHRAVGDLFEERVSFSRSSTRAIVEICLSVGVPFDFF
jgi:hypothetical protein